MSTECVWRWYAICDGCGQRLGQGYVHEEAYLTELEARDAAVHAGWSMHPGGLMYCREGDHQ